MNSMRARLIAGLVIGILLVAGVAGTGLYLSIHHTIHREYDAALSAKAAALASLVHIEEGRPELELNDLLRAEFSPRNEAEYFELFDEHGDVITRSPSLNKTDLPADKLSLFDLTLPDGRPGRAAAITFAPEVDHDEAGKNQAYPRMTLVVARDTEHVQHTLEKVAQNLVFAGLAMALTSAALIWILVTREMRPLRALGERAAAIDAGKLSLRFPTHFPQEIEPIAVALNELLSRLEIAFERERRFAADVAHELRTPVAEVRTLCEVALMEKDDLRQQQRAVRDILDVSKHMHEMVDRLLALARCEAGRQVVELRPIDLPETAKRVIARIGPPAARIEVHVTDATIISADAAMVEAIVLNLLRNAIDYSPPGSRITCNVQGNQVEIVNPQNGLTAGNLGHIFEPFWRSDASRTGEHTGLGLSLVKAYCRAMRAEVSARLVSDELHMTLRFQRGSVRAEDSRALLGKG